MKQIFVNELIKNDEITDFFMVKSCSIRVGSNHKQYFDVMLGDKTGEVSGKKWDVQEEEQIRLKKIREGEIVRVKAQVIEWQNAKQLRIQRIRPAVESDGVRINDFIKSAPEKPEDMYRYIYDIADKLEDSDLRKLCLRVLTDNKDKLRYYPAASRNHHAMFAGLLYHTKRMLMNGIGVCSVYTELDRDLLCAGVILHDIEKINEIMSDETGVSPGYSVEGQFLGHLVMGVKYIDKLAEELGVPEEKKLMIEQMILSHHYHPEFGSPVRPLFPEGEVLHFLDIMDARLFDMFDVLSSVDPGRFSEKVWTLDNRRIYKRND